MDRGKNFEVVLLGGWVAIAKYEFKGLGERKDMKNVNFPHSYEFFRISHISPHRPRAYIQGKKLEIFLCLLRQDNVIGGGEPDFREWGRENGTNFRK